MLNQAVFAPWTVGNLPPTTAAWICGEFTATENRSIRPQSRKTLRQAPLNLLADDQTQKVFFFFAQACKKKEFQSAEVPSLPYQRTVSNSFPQRRQRRLEAAGDPRACTDLWR